ncbi:hypothetical protein HMPREF1624_04539 [Sporothrix schenckii ATCC 58251]|uniref:AB hydrolase-1 domain-containing protein n=1 Tax=Sporothrix schenckii (strain ATCC 58251 / de Perez 2211183) TaxID=1391915 RepID=U7PXZ1_SPOS1|nr:hypothetical protein HMPREF1624_04539 [Sporothrix schenckii ATCC 58251]
MASKLTPDDGRVTHHTAPIRGKTYHYIVAVPPAGQTAKGTIILIHGFPDLGFGWRNQIPLLAEQLGLQVIVPDMLGYGQTDAPHEPAPYAYKSVCEDLVAIVDHVGVVGGGGPAGAADESKRFFVGGHDWGGAVAWRMALWHPDRLRGVFSVCTPYFAPSKNPFLPLDDMAKLLPNFGYQKQFAGDELWRFIDAEPQRVRQFLQTMYGGKATLSEADVAAKKSPYLFDTTNGVHMDRIAGVGPTPLLNEAEIEYYAKEYARHGLRGPTNWYRTLKYNYDDEREIVGGDEEDEDKADVYKRKARSVIRVPSLMLAATNDQALPPILSEQMGKHFTNLTKSQVPGGHWVLWQSAAAVNERIKNFLVPLLDGTTKAAL